MRIRPALWRATSAVCLVVLCSTTCAQVGDDSGGSAAASQAFGADAADVGKGISAEIIEKLMAGEKYTVVDRSAVKASEKTRFPRPLNQTVPAPQIMG
jgi:hypothetical protein